MYLPSLWMIWPILKI
ncbi:unnamed protein product [Spirodela intermedia]|uniref:Uncharacterized protein n=1 Tax=Spirodela intermedia TaxID=51605 RepID=A0A7I8LGG2_SPIIN|nr:unnamed protein product [Spirodela intermedia]